MQTCGRCKVPKGLEEFSPSYRGKSGTWCRSCFAAYNRQRKLGITPPASRPHVLVLVCQGCCSEYIPRQLKSTPMFCSRACKDTHRNQTRQEAIDIAKPDRRCPWCGSVLPKMMRADAKFCSDRCNSAAHTVTRKMAKRASAPRRDNLVERDLIALRDRFRCGICGGQVDTDLRHPDPFYGSIDHIVPVAEHGSSGLDNLQLAHLRCNLAKRDRLITPTF